MHQSGGFGVLNRVSRRALKAGKYFIFLVTSFLSSSVFAANYSFMAGVEFPSATAVSTGYTGSPLSFQYGGGLLIGYHMLSSLSAEWGLLYLPRGFNQTFSSTSVASPVVWNSIQIPLLLRVSLMPTFSIGLGGYFSHGIGSMTTSAGLVPFGGNNGVNSYGADDYGIVGSAKLKIELIPSLSLVIDGRYLIGFVNINKNAGASTVLTDFQGLAGIQFGR